MKKAIFLVEDIQENRPITLPEKILGKNVADYDISVGYREIGAMLYNAPSDYITFKKVYEFMSEKLLLLCVLLQKSVHLVQV